MSSAARSDSNGPAPAPATTEHRPARQLRHVAFFLDNELEDSDAASEKPRVGRGMGRRGVQTTMTADEHRAWSTRAAESDALRQRALQCGDDIARVASGLGYEVVAHTPTAFLKRNSASVAAPPAVSKPEVAAPRRFAAAESGPASVVGTAAPPSPPCAAAPSQAEPAFLREYALDSCSSRSSSPGTEEQVGMVPVLSPMLHGDEVAERRFSDDGELLLYDVALPRALSTHGGAARYAPLESSTPSLQEEEFNWHESNNYNTSENRGSPFLVARENFPVSRPDNTANPLPPPSVNVAHGGRSTPMTAQSSPRPSPSPRQSLTPRRVLAARSHSGAVASLSANVVQVRATATDVASSRGTSNANTSVSVEHLNGFSAPALRMSQNANRLLTPAADVLNTPAVSTADDEIWPRTFGRPIQ